MSPAPASPRPRPAPPAGSHAAGSRAAGSRAGGRAPSAGRRAALGAVLALCAAASRRRPPAPAPASVPELPEWRRRQLLCDSVESLRKAAPGLSASRRCTAGQSALAAVALLACALGVVLDARLLGILLVAAATAVYALTLGYRSVLVWRALTTDVLTVVGEDEARALPDDALPVYTILVPAFHEPEVIGVLVARLGALEYPPGRLDIKVLLEEEDDATLAAVTEASPGSSVQVVLVPAGPPQTKPKACNYGLRLARGEYVTIFDAEDRPEPLQLRRAVAAFRRLGPRYACLQACLRFYNGGQNRITRWFEVEYLTWFRHLLPGLVALGGPIPLGGTSNHLRRSALEAAGGWDPFNVTEDADLGVRLHRLGYRVGLLDSTTQEEANSDFLNWAKQRSRWYKGYLQTWLVHSRSPRQLWRDLGPAGFLGFHAFVGGTPLLSLLNLVFWAMTLLYALASPRYVTVLFPAPVYYPAVLCLAVGNLAVVYMSVLVVRETRRGDLVVAALLSPVYWVMMGIAAVKALVQLLREPWLWEKTRHGLDASAPEVRVAAG